jgi:hypothetical protein
MIKLQHAVVACVFVLFSGYSFGGISFIPEMDPTVVFLIVILGLYLAAMAIVIALNILLGLWWVVMALWILSRRE